MNHYSLAGHSLYMLPSGNVKVKTQQILIRCLIFLTALWNFLESIIIVLLQTSHSQAAERAESPECRRPATTSWVEKAAEEEGTSWSPSLYHRCDRWLLTPRRYKHRTWNKTNILILYTKSKMNRLCYHCFTDSLQKYFFHQDIDNYHFRQKSSTLKSDISQNNWLSSAMIVFIIIF